MAYQSSSTSSDGGREWRDYTMMEQAYKDKKKEILNQLQKLNDGTHPEYIKKLKEFEDQKNNQLMINNLWRDNAVAQIESEYVRKCIMVHTDFKKLEDELENIKIGELMDRKKAIELDIANTGLCPEESDVKPYLTRKLRRRPNEPTFVPSPNPHDKRRKVFPLSSIQFMLSDSDIETDIKDIQESKSLIPPSSVKEEIKMEGNPNSVSVIKSGVLQSKVFVPYIKKENSDSEESCVSNIRIEGGKLLFEKIWYHRGQPVFVEGTNITQFSAVISSIGNETIWVKKTSDNSKFRVKLACLSKQTMSIKRRAAV